jgi:hypothetical protein
MPKWTIRVTPQVRAWLRSTATNDFDTYGAINAAIDELAEHGPALGRPLVDTLRGSTIHNLKELRPRSGSRISIRILFAFDPSSQAVLLVGGNKAGNWQDWYKTAIREAERLYQSWLSQQGESNEGSREGRGEEPGR